MDDPSFSVVPLECSQQEYDELLLQAEELTESEAQQELLDGARYGEVDVVRALCSKYASPSVSRQKAAMFVDIREEGSGSTPLHKAAANGHVDTCRLLIHFGAKHLTNEKGNTPLHWAAANGCDDVVRLLLQSYSEIDVLQKNAFGRSTLTEGFSSSGTNHRDGSHGQHNPATADTPSNKKKASSDTANGDDKTTSVVQLLLEHESATEEKLLGGATQVKEEDAASQESTSSSKTHVVHEFDLLKATKNGNEKESDPSLLIRELPIAHADNPFGDSAVEDTTGFSIWCASLVMARWMASMGKEHIHNKNVLELGAGCGVPGLATAVYNKPKSVYLTDLNPITVRNLQHNVNLNKDRFAPNMHVEAICMDWDDKSSWPITSLDSENGVQVVIGSDLIYQSSIVPLLLQTLVGLLNEGGIFFYVAPEEGRDGLAEFLELLPQRGFSLIQRLEAPLEYLENPLKSGDEEECFLHFNELSSSSSNYILYEFQKKSN